MTISNFLSYLWLWTLDLTGTKILLLYVIRKLRERRKCSVLKKNPFGIKKPLKQGKVNFYWHVVCNINMAVFQPRSKHNFSGLGEVLGFHQVKNTDWLSQQKLWDSREALWSVRVWFVACTENPVLCLYWTYKNLFDNMLHMIQRITSYHENESSLTHIYKGTLFSHLIDLAG